MSDDENDERGTDDVGDDELGPLGDLSPFAGGGRTSLSASTP